MFHNGSTWVLRPGSERRLVHRDVGGARLRLGRDVRDLVVAERLDQQHLVTRGARQRVVGEMLRVAVALAAVPQHLGEAELRPAGRARPG